MNEQQAVEWFDQLKQGLLSTQDAVEKIVANKAWVPLGYDTFQAAWDDRLSDVKLTGALRATVVLAMFDGGASDVEVTTTVNGVGPVHTKAYRQAHRAGLDPKQASLHVSKAISVKPYKRSLPVKRNAITIKGFTDEELTAMNEIAESLGVERNEMLREWLRGEIESRVDGYVAI